jgi:hypothetical protein
MKDDQVSGVRNIVMGEIRNESTVLDRIPHWMRFRCIWENIKIDLK